MAATQRAGATTRRRSTRSSKGARPTAITKLSDRPGYKNWAIVGETGVGKTVLAGTAPRALFLTFEVEGTESAKAHGSDADEITINNREDYLGVYDYLDVGTGCDDFDWVIVDSGSEMEECFWVSHLRAQKERKPTTRSLYKPALDDYPIVWNQMKAAIEIGRA